MERITLSIQSIIQYGITDTIRQWLNGHSFLQSKYESKIRDLDNPLSINANGGMTKLHQKCDISYTINVWYNGNSITNIISMKDMTEKFRVMMKSK